MKFITKWIIAGIISVSLIIILILIPLLIFQISPLLFIYNYFDSVWDTGIFFLLFMMLFLCLFPTLIFSVRTKPRQFQPEELKVRKKNFRDTGIMLLIIGIPNLVIWTISGLYYYNFSQFGGGLGEFARNGALTIMILIFFICIIFGLFLMVKQKLQFR